MRSDTWWQRVHVSRRILTTFSPSPMWPFSSATHPFEDFKYFSWFSTELEDGEVLSLLDERFLTWESGLWTAPSLSSSTASDTEVYLWSYSTAIQLGGDFAILGDEGSGNKWGCFLSLEIHLAQWSCHTSLQVLGPLSNLQWTLILCSDFLRPHLSVRKETGAVRIPSTDLSPLLSALWFLLSFSFPRTL